MVGRLESSFKFSRSKEGVRVRTRTPTHAMTDGRQQVHPFVGDLRNCAKRVSMSIAASEGRLDMRIWCNRNRHKVCEDQIVDVHFRLAWQGFDIALRTLVTKMGWDGTILARFRKMVVVIRCSPTLMCSVEDSLHHGTYVDTPQATYRVTHAKLVVRALCPMGSGLFCLKLPFSDAEGGGELRR